MLDKELISEKNPNSILNRCADYLNSDVGHTPKAIQDIGKLYEYAKERLDMNKEKEEISR